MKRFPLIKVLIFLVGIVALFLNFSCRYEEEGSDERIENIKFETNKTLLQIGEEVSVRVVATPYGGKINEIIKYSTSQEGVVEVKDTSNDGFVLTAVDYGSVVVIAESANFTGYLEIRVEGGNFIAKPYILVSMPVVELNEGEMRNMQVTLYGGSVLDNNGFSYRLESNKENIEIDTALNTVVIKGKERGNQKIIVSHPKADYDSEILVFVKTHEEPLRYITSASNVILLEAGGQYRHLQVSLFGGSPLNNAAFEYTVVEGANVVEVAHNNEIFNLRAKEAGTALLRITHPLAEMGFEVRVIAVSADMPLITLDKTFILLEIGTNTMVTAQVQNPVSGTSLNDFSFEVVEGERCVEVIQANNQFFIHALEGGPARIRVMNSQADYSREILVIVRSEFWYRDDFYITTSQNVIQTQVGDPMIRLSMVLVGGNEADANGFSWTVSDGSIIEVDTPHGKTDYIIPLQRSQISSAFSGEAWITPLRSGQAEITVVHPKSEVQSKVIVKVYPKNTFQAGLVYASAPGLIKVLRGTPYPVTLDVEPEGGETGEIEWSISDIFVASLDTEVKGLTNIINGVSSGQTRLRVEGRGLRIPHESIILSGTQAELDAAKVIYVDNIFQIVGTGQAVRVQVKDSEGILGSDGRFRAVVENDEILYAVMVQSQLVLQGKQPGETSVRVSHPEATNEWIDIKVRVEASGLSMDKPYFISGPEIVGLVNGKETTIKIRLEGAGGGEAGKIIWGGDGEGVISIIANGEEARVTGKINNRQSVIRISHPKAELSKTIIVYVVGSEAELNNAVVLGLDKQHYLLSLNSEPLFLRLKTNASDTDKLQIQWNVKYGSDVVWVDPHYDSANIRAIGVGNAEIEITHSKNILPVSVFVSVVENISGEKHLQVVPVIELIIGQSRIIEANTVGFTQIEKDGIRWDIEDTDVAAIQENGAQVYISGKRKGITYLNVKHVSLGLRQRVTVLCAETAEELASMYVIGTEKTYYKIQGGEEKRINLIYGSSGFPENLEAGIVWAAGNNGVVRVLGNGRSATVIGIGEGIGTVEVGSPSLLNTILLTFEVSGHFVISDEYEFRGHEKIKGIIIGDTVTIPMKMYDKATNTEVLTGYSLLEVGNEDDEVISVDCVENILSITAKKEGKSYIAIRHPKVAETARILIYTAADQAGLDAYYPISAEKTNYLVQLGETVEIKLITEESKDGGNLDQIQWGIENSGIIDSPQFTGKKMARIKGTGVGNCIINISFKGKVVEKIYLSIVTNDIIDFTKRINTENIIGLVRGGSKTTTISSNLTVSELQSLVWSTEVGSRVQVNGNGGTAVITAPMDVQDGYETYVNVKFGSFLERKILVYVCDTEEKVKNYRAMNSEIQYIRIGKNETVIVPIYFAPNKPVEETVWEDRYGNDVIRYITREGGSRAEVTGLNEGVAVLDVWNSGRTNNGRPVTIYFEVSERYGNIVREGESEILKYLTISKTLYAINPDEPLKELNISVTAIGMSSQETQGIVWSKSNNSISIFPNGDSCKILPNEEGETVVNIFHPASSNFLDVRVIVTRNTVMEGVPYIYFNDVIRVGLGEVKTMKAEILGIDNYDKNGFIVNTDNDNIEISCAGDIVSITGKKSGQSKVTVTHPSVIFSKESMAVVTMGADGLIYLTTNDNFGVVAKNQYKLIRAELVGFEESDNSEFKWKVADGYEKYISVSGNGLQAQVQGKETGTGRIDLIHRYGLPPIFWTGG